MKTPKIITISCTKGGVGKSTVAVNLAIALAEKYAVTILDLDYQRSATLFNKVRTFNNIEPFQVIRAESETDIKKIIKSNKELLIIDTGAFDSNFNRLAIMASDLVLTPISDSEVDIFGLVMFNRTLKDIKAERPKFKAYVLRNKMTARTKNETEIINQVKLHGKTLTLLNTRLSDRTAYKNTFITGLGVTEGRKTAAVEEMKKLVKEVEKCLKK